MSTSEKIVTNGTGAAPNGFHKERNSSESDTDDEEDHRCGYCGYRPAWMQVFNNPKFLCVLLSAFAFIQSFVVNGINNVNTTSYERRFGLSSSQVGIISSAYDISAGVVVLPITYLALTCHKHTILAIAVGVMGLGSFLMLLPQISTGPYEWGQGASAMCTTANSTACPQVPSDLSNYLYLLIAGQLLHGVGGSTIYSVGISCMDDCVPTKSAPVYVGILYAFSALGPAAGYMLGGYLLDIYVDFTSVPSPLLTSSDPRWVGAWWLGFILSMTLAWLMFLPLLGLPRELPGTKQVKASRVSEAHQDGSEEKHLGASFREFPKVTLMLLKNPTFMLISLAASSEGILVSGFATFIPKLIQNQFGQTAGFSAILTGVMAVPGAAGGYLLGGYLCRRFKLKIRAILRLCALACLISVIAAATMWARCEQTKIAGVTASYDYSKAVLSIPNLDSPCNTECGCTQESYTPVCGANGLQYFSPCHAGCSESIGENYTSCACVNRTSTYNETAVGGVCDTSCPLLYVFLPIFFILMVVTFAAATPTTMATLRCVPLSHKTFALGVQWVFARFLGTVPGPIFFGVIIDSACVIWKRSCGSAENESCWIYDDYAMSRNFFIVAIGVKSVSTFFFVVASFVYKAPYTHKVEDTKTENTEADYQSTRGTIPLTETGVYRKLKSESETRGQDNPALEP